MAKMLWQKASDVKKRIVFLVTSLKLNFVDLSRVYCYRSQGSKSRAYARMWGLPKIWQVTLKKKPSYILEVLSEHFDKLSERQKDHVLIHELSHIPANFSGALTPHYRRGKRSFRKKVDSMIKSIFANKI